MERTLIQSLLFINHHHHEDGSIYYNEKELLEICNKMEEDLMNKRNLAVKKKDMNEMVENVGKIDLIREMKEFFEHKV